MYYSCSFFYQDYNKNCCRNSQGSTFTTWNWHRLILPSRKIFAWLHWRQNPDTTASHYTKRNSSLQTQYLLADCTVYLSLDVAKGIKWTYFTSTADFSQAHIACTLLLYIVYWYVMLAWNVTINNWRLFQCHSAWQSERLFLNNTYHA